VLTLPHEKQRIGIIIAAIAKEIGGDTHQETGDV